jgi:hypothetical protein
MTDITNAKFPLIRPEEGDMLIEIFTVAEHITRCDHSMLLSQAPMFDAHSFFAAIIPTCDVASGIDV